MLLRSGCVFRTFSTARCSTCSIYKAKIVVDIEVYYNTVNQCKMNQNLMKCLTMCFTNNFIFANYISQRIEIILWLILWIDVADSKTSQSKYLIGFKTDSEHSMYLHGYSYGLVNSMDGEVHRHVRIYCRLKHTTRGGYLQYTVEFIISSDVYLRL